MPSSSPDRLQLSADPAHQELFWRAERVAWVVFAAVIVVALLGLTGHGGPLARAQASGTAAVLDYPRVARWHADDHFVLDLKGAEASQTLVVEIDRKLLDLFAVDAIQPMPRSSVITERGVRLFYDRPGAAGGRVWIQVTPLRPSLFERVEVAVDGTPLRARPLILP